MMWFGCVLVFCGVVVFGMDGGVVVEFGGNFNFGDLFVFVGVVLYFMYVYRIG